MIGMLNLLILSDGGLLLALQPLQEEEVLLMRLESIEGVGRFT